MRYLSVCSGIEAATVAWHHLGWTPVAFSEIEPFPAAVLKHHYPNVPNLGDMTKHEQWQLARGSIDLLVGGTPCQSFSVAGLRRGISDPRGGLMLTYLEIARRLRPRWIVWENVPGVLSSGGGRDFGSFLGALGHLGYGWAYRVLDAQWIRTQRHPRAVPQRRRRVFVVGCAGDWERAASVLFERESVCRDSAPRRAPGQGSAADAEAGATASRWWDGSDCAGTLTKQNANGAQRMPDKDNFGAVLQPVVGALDCRIGAQRAQNAQAGHMIPVAIQGNLIGRDAGGPHGVGASDEGTMYTLTKADVHGIAQPVPFTKAKRAQSTTDDETWVDGEVAPTMSLFDQGDVRATTVAVATGVDLYNQELTGDIHCPLRTAPGHGAPAVAFPINGMCTNKELRDKQMTGTGTADDPMYTIRADGTQHAVAHTLRGESFDASEDGTGRGTPIVPQAMTVRRLTPVECERLQAFPDGYTAIPWRGKPADQCPDGPRYKALGNSMACNCMAWIGERINSINTKETP